jgi:hypothetical protein
MPGKEKVQNGCFVVFFIVFGLSFLCMIAIGDSKAPPGFLITVAAIGIICVLIAVRWMDKNNPHKDR